MTSEQGAYGANFATRFHLSSAPMLAVSIANQLQVAVTELRSDGMPELPLPIPVEEAFSIHLHLRETGNGSLWVRGQLVAEGNSPLALLVFPILKSRRFFTFPSR
jgi:AraC family transcriptional regulator